jgi:hypothetical protein
MGKSSKEITMTIEGEKVDYIRKDCINSCVINFDESSSLAGCMVGKEVLIRSRNEGINCGVVEAADETGVILKNARRLWYHKPDGSDSWYEGVSKLGITVDSKVSCTVIRKVIIEDYSITECTKTAYNSIMDKKPYAQS